MSYNFKDLIKDFFNFTEHRIDCFYKNTLTNKNVKPTIIYILQKDKKY